MMASRLDITQIYGEIDDFYLQWSRQWYEQKQLPSMPQEKRCRSRMTLSEVMTIDLFERLDEQQLQLITR
jgi:hypothetical protein